MLGHKTLNTRPLHLNLSYRGTLGIMTSFVGKLKSSTLRGRARMREFFAAGVLSISDN